MRKCIKLEHVVMNCITFLDFLKSNLKLARLSAWAALPLVVLAVIGCSQAGSNVSELNATAAPAHLQTQLRVNPLALNAVHPRLGWVLPWKGNGQFQSAYEILVASSPKLLNQNTGNLWNTGKVFSHDSINIRYAGPALNSRQRCFWKVRVWNQAGQPSHWSQTAQWQEGLLTPGRWHHAQWIGWKPAPKMGIRHPLPAIYLRDQFNVSKSVKRAVAYFCGLGYGRMYVNGQRTSDTQLSPGLSWYPKRCYYVTRNVTNLLKPGKNAVGVILGDGRMYGMGGVAPYTIHISPRMIFMLHITYKDGTSATITSNTHWKMTDAGPIRMNNIYNGETYNLAMRMPGWNKAGYAANGWKNAVAVRSPGGRLVAESQQPIRITQILHPIKVAQIAPGKWMFDMGQNMVGWCQIKIPNGPAGTKVVLRHGESLVRNGQQTVDLNPAGKGRIHLYVANLRTAKQTDTVILNGKGRVTWHPIFTYHGFRFVELTGYPGTPTLHTLEGMEVVDALPRAGGFACSDKLINQILHNCRWGIQNNHNSIPTDCPQRDERQGWMGDRGMESRSETFFFNTERFFDKWLWDMQDAQRPSGDVSDVNPPYWAVYTKDVTWPSTFIYLPGTLYVQYGQLSPIRDHYAAMSKWMNYQLAKVHDGITKADQYGDWCSPPRSPKNIHSRDPNRATPGALLATATLYKDLHLMASYAKLLHNTSGRAHWLAAAHTLYVGFNKHLWNAKGGYYGNGSDTACVLPLAAGIVPVDRQAAVMKRLLWRIDERQDDHVGVGVIGMQWMFNVMAHYGQANLVWKMLNQTTYPGWGYMVKHGATTVWELWNGNTANPAMNSQDHVMFIGDMLTWLFQYAGGIQSDPSEPGFEHIIMKPHFLNGLTYVNAWHQSPYGRIISDWKITSDGTFQWHVRVPANSFATVKIPAASATAVTLNGHKIANKPWIKFVAYVNGRVIYMLESGNYQFRSALIAK
jgi:alpha-L-rhamnosidase